MQIRRSRVWIGFVLVGTLLAARPPWTWSVGFSFGAIPVGAWIACAGIVGVDHWQGCLGAALLACLQVSFTMSSGGANEGVSQTPHLVPDDFSMIHHSANGTFNYLKHDSLTYEWDYLELPDHPFNLKARKHPDGSFSVITDGYLGGMSQEDYDRHIQARDTANSGNCVVKEIHVNYNHPLGYQKGDPDGLKLAAEHAAQQIWNSPPGTNEWCSSVQNNRGQKGQYGITFVGDGRCKPPTNRPACGA